MQDWDVPDCTGDPTGISTAAEGNDETILVRPIHTRSDQRRSKSKEGPRHIGGISPIRIALLL